MTTRTAKTGNDGGEVILRLPPYFPTTRRACEEVTTRFFTCFEQHAIMHDDTDATTAATSLQHCQPELRAYMQCMERELAKRNAPPSRSKPWWRVW